MVEAAARRVGKPPAERRAEAAMRILALIYGRSVQAAIPQRMSYQAVWEMVLRSTGREPGMAPFCLTGSHC